jgi:hypothetical protein
MTLQRPPREALGRGDDCRLTGAQEGVGRKLQGEAGGDRRQACLAQAPRLLLALDQGWVVRLNPFGEAQIRQGVLVGAENEGLGGEDCDAPERRRELLEGPVEDPPAPARE